MSNQEYQTKCDSSSSGPHEPGQDGGQTEASIFPQTPATVQHPDDEWDLEAALEREEHERIWTKCKHLAEVPVILNVFAKDLSRLGLAGERRPAMLLFLALVSRLLERPVSIAMKGPSAAGKSNLVDLVLKFFPERAYYLLSAMSEKALAYSAEPMSHRFLVLYEAAGLQSQFSNYLVRSLLSEGRLKYETVEKTEKGFTTRTLEREGPSGLITTTTKVQLHRENETRYLSVPVNDTPDQTRKVMMAMAEQRRVPPDLTAWHALHEWLERGERRVVIPYAVTLAEMIPPVAVRLRRDFRTILNLISAHALLQQATRPRDGEGQIVAGFQDYAAVRMLVGDLVAEGVESTVSRIIHETVAAVAKLTPCCADEASLSTVAKELGLDKSAVSRRVCAALQFGYLRNLETQHGRPFRLVIGDPLPVDLEVLPDSKALRARCCSVAQQFGDTQGGPEQAKDGER